MTRQLVEPPEELRETVAPDVRDERANEAAKIMFDALTRITQSRAFFEETKRIRLIAVSAIQRLQKLAKGQKP